MWKFSVEPSVCRHARADPAATVAEDVAALPRHITAQSTVCNVSMIMDTYRPHIPDPRRWPPTYPGPITIPVPSQPPVAPVTPEKLRELIESFRQAVKAAETFDRLTGQPDCVDPEKAKLEERVAELEKRLDEMAKAAAGG